MTSKNPDQVVSVEFDNDTVLLRLADGRLIGNPLSWHPWLRHATPAQRHKVELYELAVYFPGLDDGLDVDEMMKGEPGSRERAGPHVEKEE